MTEAPDKVKNGSELAWQAQRPGEMLAKIASGAQVRIKQSIGKGGSDCFWYCYHDGRYVGVEKTLPLAKSRAVSGRMRLPSNELEEWLKQHGDKLPDDLLSAEKERLAAWKKNPAPSPRLTEPHPNPRAPGRAEAGGGAIAAEKRLPVAEASALRAKVTAAGKGERPTGRLKQDAKVVVLRREYTGKDGTKWRQRQAHVFECDGKLVREIGDDDALKNMIRDAQVKLEG